MLMLLLPVILLWVSHRKDMPRNKWEVPCHLWSPQKTVFTSNWTDRAPWPCAWGDILESCSPWALGTEHGRLEAGQAHPNTAPGLSRTVPGWPQPSTQNPPRSAVLATHCCCGPGARDSRSAVALLAHPCLGATAVPGSHPHLGEASLALFQSQDHHHHHPHPAQERAMTALKERKRWQSWQSSDTRLGNCSTPQANKHHAGGDKSLESSILK